MPFDEPVSMGRIFPKDMTQEECAILEKLDQGVSDSRIAAQKAVNLFMGESSLSFKRIFLIRLEFNKFLRSLVGAEKQDTKIVEPEDFYIEELEKGKKSRPIAKVIKKLMEERGLR